MNEAAIENYGSPYLETFQKILLHREGFRDDSTIFVAKGKVRSVKQEIIINGLLIRLPCQ